MIVALFALAAIMVIGGSAAVVQGFPFVRLESGLAMVIAGAGTASAGAVLFGLAVVATWLRRLERALGARASLPAATAPAFPARIEPSQAGLRPTLPGTPAMPDTASGAFALPAASGALGGAALGGLAGSLAGTLGGRRQAEPTFEDSLFEPRSPEADPEPELPIPGLSPLPHEPVAAEPEPVVEAPHPEPDDGISPDDDLFAAPAQAPEAESPAPEPVSEPESTPEPPVPAELRPSLAEPEPSEEAPRKEIVGKHASGGNTYVMFADGSIEAETPQGRYTFASLDELKAFVDAGGEAGARGAA